jgi:hypothetical protein
MLSSRFVVFRHIFSARRARRLSMKVRMRDASFDCHARPFHPPPLSGRSGAWDKASSLQSLTLLPSPRLPPVNAGPLARVGGDLLSYFSTLRFFLVDEKAATADALAARLLVRDIHDSSTCDTTSTPLQLARLQRLLIFDLTRSLPLVRSRQAS